jgi:hypothetical protein
MRLPEKDPKFEEAIGIATALKNHAVDEHEKREIAGCQW